MLYVYRPEQSHDMARNLGHAQLFYSCPLFEEIIDQYGAVI